MKTQVNVFALALLLELVLLPSDRTSILPRLCYNDTNDISCVCTQSDILDVVRYVIDHVCYHSASFFYKLISLQGCGRRHNKHKTNDSSNNIISSADINNFLFTFNEMNDIFYRLYKHKWCNNKKETIVRDIIATILYVDYVCFNDPRGGNLTIDVHEVGRILYDYDVNSVSDSDNILYELSIDYRTTLDHHYYGKVDQVTHYGKVDQVVHESTCIDGGYSNIFRYAHSQVYHDIRDQCTNMYDNIDKDMNQRGKCSLWYNNDRVDLVISGLILVKDDKNYRLRHTYKNAQKHRHKYDATKLYLEGFYQQITFVHFYEHEQSQLSDEIEDDFEMMMYISAVTELVEEFCLDTISTSSYVVESYGTMILDTTDTLLWLRYLIKILPELIHISDVFRCDPIYILHYRIESNLVHSKVSSLYHHCVLRDSIVGCLQMEVYGGLKQFRTGKLTIGYFQHPHSFMCFLRHLIGCSQYTYGVMYCFNAHVFYFSLPILPKLLSLLGCARQQKRNMHNMHKYKLQTVHWNMNNNLDLFRCDGQSKSFHNTQCSNSQLEHNMHSNICLLGCNQHADRPSNNNYNNHNNNVNCTVGYSNIFADQDINNDVSYSIGTTDQDKISILSDDSDIISVPDYDIINFISVPGPNIPIDGEKRLHSTAHNIRSDGDGLKEAIFIPSDDDSVPFNFTSAGIDENYPESSRIASERNQ